jgi:hypothetical protein
MYTRISADTSATSAYVRVYPLTSPVCVYLIGDTHTHTCPLSCLSCYPSSVPRGLPTSADEKFLRRLWGGAAAAEGAERERGYTRASLGNNGEGGGGEGNIGCQEALCPASVHRCICVCPASVHRRICVWRLGEQERAVTLPGSGIHEGECARAHVSNLIQCSSSVRKGVFNARRPATLGYMCTAQATLFGRLSPLCS